MLVLWCILAGLLFYLELAFHFIGFGWTGFHPVYAILLTLVWSGIGTLLTGVLRGRKKKICFRTAVWCPIAWTCIQLVYLRIFQQPLLWEAVFSGGADALTNYWREALAGILGALPFLVLLALPAMVLLLVLRKRGWVLPDFAAPQILRSCLTILAGIAGIFLFMGIGKNIQAEYYEDYQEFYDPLTVVRSMGVLPTLHRDTVRAFSGWTDSLSAQASENDAPDGDEEDPLEGAGIQLVRIKENLSMRQDLSPAQDPDGTELGESGTAPSASGTGGEDPSASGAESEEGGTGPDADRPADSAPVPRQLPLDYELLRSMADNKSKTWMADYIEALTPTNSNEYTGRFEGYNLIYLTAEGFSTYAINQELTPTLYRLTNSGFVFENYYVPLWQTSTSDGEYINCTGLIPDGQFSMNKSASKDMAFTLPKFFAKENVPCLAYHNNSLSYYSRHLSHPNLGYDFKACKLGKLSQSEWGDKIFPMENPNAWPASDLEMMVGTVPEYLENERFHVYYMTVSGHMNYNFSGNSMSHKNKDAVSGLEMSENAQAYIACQIELDKALAYLLEQLEAAGKLEKTVICLSADHYPYGMTTEQYEELAGKSLKDGLDLFRNSLILWNSEMEEEPVPVKKVCGSMDILPTLLNLFGFEYDSRMYAGRDIFSDEEGMVIFNDRSFVTDSVVYKRGADPIWIQGEDGSDIVPEEEKEAYLKAKKQEVKDRYQFSAYVLREDYYRDVEAALLP